MGRLAVSKLLYFVSIIITLLLVAVTIAASFSSKFDPNEYPMMAMLGLALPALLLICLVFALYWGFRIRLWIWFPILAFVVNAEYLTSVIQISRTKTTDKKTIKIATFNIHNFNNEITGFTAKQIAHYMDKEKVDIICFQELSPNIDFNMDSIYNVYKAYPYTYIPTNNGQYRISVFSKYPMAETKFIPFPASSNCGLWADIEVDNKTIRVFNVHMQTTSLNQTRAAFVRKQLGDIEGEKEALDEATQTIEGNFKMRAQQAAYVRSIIDATKYPVILCGDFNDTPASYTYRELKGNLLDGFRTNGNGYGYTYRGLYDLLRIDYILYSPQFIGTDYSSPSKEWSDHNPVIMELAI